MAPRTIARAAALALTAGLLASATGTGTAYAADEPVAGGQTASPADSLFPNQGNSGYDVSHYDIDFSIDVGISATANAASTTTIDATTTVSATTTGAPLSSYSFDFQGTSTTLAASTLSVSAVTVNGTPAAFSRIENTTVPDATTDVHKLVITPTVPVTGAFTTVVEYSGQPVVHRDTDNSIEGWNNTVDGATFVNQPVGSMTLFPNNNTPRDKATYTWTVDAPSTLRTSNFAQAGGKSYQAGVVSNGELVSRTPTGGGARTTWVWDQQVPMASELTLFSIGRYDIYSSDITLDSGRTIAEWTFIDPALSAANQATTLASRAQLKAMLDFFETKYGPYPGNSTGLVTDNTTGINYALETQDRPFFPNSASRSTTIHEIMHQWWGNHVTPTDWNDLWISEGSATYSENQFAFESAGSTTTGPEQTYYAAWNSSSGTSSTWTIPTAAMTQASQLFGSQVYSRGAWTLEALRTVIGAADFETLMRTYQTRLAAAPETSTRRTAQFIALAEEISGRDLTAFFQPWLYGTTKAPWPVKFTLDVAGPTGQVNPGDDVAYTLSARNTGKVAMPAGGTTITLDLADVRDDATIGALPADTTLDGTTLTWTVPATALAATSSVTLPVTVDPGTTGARLKAVARAATLGGTCVECAPETTVGAAPISPAPTPTITGLVAGGPVVGQVLTADTTGWPAGTTFAYQWSINQSPVPGATQATYTPTGDNVGTTATVRVTGTLAGFDRTSATSAVTAPGVRATPVASTPTITGTPKIGQRLTVDPGAWQPGTVFTYQWRANGTNIAGATGAVYTPALAVQVGQTIDVVVTGTRFGYTTTARTSAATGAVAAGDPLTATPTPTLPGTPKVGAALTAVPGDWDDGVVLTYTWQANGTNISGATTVAYTPTAAVLGQPLTVTVVGTRPGVTAVSRTSAPSTVEPGTQTLQPTPTITGTPRPDSPVTGVPGTWDASTTLSYQWYVDGVVVAGNATTTYTPTVDDIGKDLTFEVTSTRTGYTTLTRSSAPATVVGYAQTSTPTPTITGTPKVGVELTAVPGTWDDGTTLAYQWLADGDAVGGATASTYTPGPDQLDAVVTVRVTGTKPDFESVSRTSDPTATVTAGDLAATPAPTITGTPKVDVELTAVTGTWDDGTTLTYQWLAGGDPVGGATASTFTPTADQVGSVVAVAVTGAKDGYLTVTRTSAPSTAVAEGDLVDTPVPTILGTPRVGVQLAAQPGAWDTGTTFGYQWFADDEAVVGATAATFTPASGQVGSVLTVEVTGSKGGYANVTRTSAPTATVVAGTQGLTPVPTISGTPRVDAPLVVSPGTWDDGTTLSYQWYVAGVPVAGATGTVYGVAPSDVGLTVTATVTGTRTGYAPVTTASAPTAVVAPGDLASTPTPVITGTPRVGLALRAEPGTWSGGAALAYQWTRDGSAVAGATGSTYLASAADAGHRLVVVVTGSKAGYTTVSRASADLGVAAGIQTARPTPVVKGVARVGRTLRVRSATYDAGVRVSYRWTAGDRRVGNGKRLVVTKKMLGRRIRVTVTATKPGYTSVVTASTRTTKVRPRR